MNENVKIDIKDRKILRELDMDARMPINKLSKRVGLSRQVVQYRIDRMKMSGLISGAITVFDSVVVGERWFRVILRLQKITKEEKLKFIAYLINHPNALWIGEVGGNWDFVLNFVAADQFVFNNLFEKLLEQWGGFIQNYEVIVYINVRDQARSYLLQQYETKTDEMFHEMRYKPEIKLDELDKKIISFISKNAWLSNSEIATKLGVSYKTVQNRIRDMEKNRLILGYKLLIRPRMLGYEAHMLFLGIHSYKPQVEKELYGFLKQSKVTYLVKQLGRWRFGMEVEVSSNKEFQDFLVELRNRFGDIISSYETFPIFYDHRINYFPEGCLRQ